MTELRLLDPRHGIHNPCAGTPARRPGSIRRTTTIDCLRPGGLEGPLVVIGRARDLITASDGTARLVDEARFEARIAYADDYRLVTLDTLPARPEVARLIGASVSSGFRSKVIEAMPDLRDDATALHLLLDDFPGAALVSGYVMVRARIPRQRAGKFALQFVDMCSGWREGGTLASEYAASGQTLVPTPTGPVAPPPITLDDALSWHGYDLLPAHGMRRARRMDVHDDGTLRFDIWFRDSHMSAERDETVLHEYTTRGGADCDGRTLLDISSEARVLPWQECIGAVESGTWLAGRSIAGLRQSIRAEFTGTHTCTHLNDTLRSLEDLPALARALHTR